MGTFRKSLKGGANSRQISENLKKLNKDLGLAELSMGMSSDYLNALEFNSTYLRIGSSIFGQRV